MKPKACLVLTLFGGFDARARSGSPLVLPARKAQGLLAYLALPLGRAHPREKLAALLWGDMPDAQARGNLRQALSRIQKAWAGAAVPGMLFRGDTIALDPSAVEVDVGAFERLLADGRPGALEQAVERYRGDLLEGLALPERAFDEWLTAERERLHELAIKALGRLLAHQSTTETDDQALWTARRLLELDPLEEAVHRLVMRLHSQHGRRTAALRQYQICVDHLERELRAEPEAETRQLHQEILRSRPQRLDRVASPGPVADVETREAPSRVPGAIEQATPLVGREEEAARFHALLAEVGAGESRVVALVGEAGIGKSRLLEELAALATRRRLRVLSARSYESEQVLPFGPWVDALRAGGVVDDHEVLRELSPALRTDLAHLFLELGDGQRAGALRTNPLRVFTAFARLIAVAGARRPLAIVLDDFHWADEMRGLGWHGGCCWGWHRGISHVNVYNHWGDHVHIFLHGPMGRRVTGRRFGGDVYAGRDGHVYRRDGLGHWQEFNRGGGWAGLRGSAAEHERSYQAREIGQHRLNGLNREGPAHGFTGMRGRGGFAGGVHGGGGFHGGGAHGGGGHR
jgi:DNA-binding SARP family transcriptional activator